MAYALMWTDHFNEYANQDLQEMEKRAVVGKEYKLINTKSEPPLGTPALYRHGSLVRAVCLLTGER